MGECHLGIKLVVEVDVDEEMFLEKKQLYGMTKWSPKLCQNFSSPQDDEKHLGLLFSGIVSYQKAPHAEKRACGASFFLSGFVFYPVFVSSSFIACPSR